MKKAGYEISIQNNPLLLMLCTFFIVLRDSYMHLFFKQEQLVSIFLSLTGAQEITWTNLI